MSRNVLIEGCRFDQREHALAITSGTHRDGWRLNVPTENVVVINCGRRRPRAGRSACSASRQTYAWRTLVPNA